MLRECNDTTSQKNLVPSELGLDVPRKAGRPLFEIKIHSIELSISFAK